MADVLFYFSVTIVFTEAMVASWFKVSNSGPEFMLLAQSLEQCNPEGWSSWGSTCNELSALEKVCVACMSEAR